MCRWFKRSNWWRWWCWNRCVVTRVNCAVCRHVDETRKRIITCGSWAIFMQRCFLKSSRCKVWKSNQIIFDVNINHEQFYANKPGPCSWAREKQGTERDFTSRIIKIHILMEGTSEERVWSSHWVQTQWNQSLVGSDFTYRKYQKKNLILYISTLQYSPMSSSLQKIFHDFTVIITLYNQCTSYGFSWDALWQVVFMIPIRCDTTYLTIYNIDPAYSYPRYLPLISLIVLCLQSIRNSSIRLISCSTRGQRQSFHLLLLLVLFQLLLYCQHQHSTGNLRRVWTYARGNIRQVWTYAKLLVQTAVLRHRLKSPPDKNPVQTNHKTVTNHVNVNTGLRSIHNVIIPCSLQNYACIPIYLFDYISLRCISNNMKFFLALWVPQIVPKCSEIVAKLTSAST